MRPVWMMQWMSIMKSMEKSGKGNDSAQVREIINAAFEMVLTFYDDDKLKIYS